MTRKKTAIVRAVKGYDAVLADVVALIDAGRRGSIRTTNAIMTATYWGVGRRIVEGEQHGATRADYGDALISRLSQDLQAKFGRGFGYVNLTRSTWGTARFFRRCLQNLSPCGPARNFRQRLKNSSASTS